MTQEEFRAWLRDEVVGGRMSPEELLDLVNQQTLFAERFGTPDDPLPAREVYRRRIVGYVAEQLLVANEIHALIDAAKRDFPSRMIYFEPIGFDLF
jgi:hypothetical protein